MSTRSRRNPRRRGRKSRQQRIKERNRAVLLLILAGIAVIILAIAAYRLLFAPFKEEAQSVSQMTDEEWEGAPPLDVQLLTVNEYSRPGLPLEKIDGIVIHYTANPGTSAQENRNYFEGLKDEHTTKASSHFIIGMEGEIVQCIPSTEIAYASNDRNGDTLSIECCHPDESGKFTDATYQSLVDLTAWLCGRFQIPVENVIRHYDVTGKDCPKYFVEHEDAWQQFKEDVSSAVDAGNGE